jgi:hypothetical protein
MSTAICYILVFHFFIVHNIQMRSYYIELLPSKRSREFWCQFEANSIRNIFSSYVTCKRCKKTSCTLIFETTDQSWFYSVITNYGRREQARNYCYLQESKKRFEVENVRPWSFVAFLVHGKECCFSYIPKALRVHHTKYVYAGEKGSPLSYWTPCGLLKIIVRDSGRC